MWVLAAQAHLKIQNHLGVALEEEQERRAVLAKDFIKSTEAREAMLQIISEVLTRLDKLALDCAEGCNPENPAKAVKVLENWVDFPWND